MEIGKFAYVFFLQNIEVSFVKKYTRDVKGIIAFGSRLREVRKSKGISQEELSYLADVEHSQISRIERGVINTSLSQIFQIARALKIHPKELLDFEIEEL